MPIAVAKAAIVLKVHNMMVDILIDLAAANLNWLSNILVVPFAWELFPDMVTLSARGTIQLAPSIVTNGDIASWVVDLGRRLAVA